MKMCLLSIYQGGIRYLPNNFQHRNNILKNIQKSRWVRCLSLRPQSTADNFLVQQLLGNQIEGDSKGQIQSVQGSLASVTGLRKARIGDTVYFGDRDSGDGSKGYVMELHCKNTVVAVADPKHSSVFVGGAAFTDFEPLSVPVGNKTLGRVLDPLGIPVESLDKKGALSSDIETMPVWGKNHVQGYSGRDKRLQIIRTGIGALDVFHPVLEGQLLLVQGAEGAGKTLLISEILRNQTYLSNQGVKCVYVSIGHSAERVSRLLHEVSEAGSFENLTVVHAPPNNLALSYLAPFAGATMAEFWKNEGFKALVVHDCLTAHAHAFNLLTKKARVSNYQKGNGLGLHGPLFERNVCMSNGSSLTTVATVANDLGQGDSDTAAVVAELSSVADDVVKLDRKSVSKYFPNFRLGESCQGRIGLGSSEELRLLARTVWSKMIKSNRIKASSKFAEQLGISLEEEEVEGMDLAEFILTAQSMLSQKKGTCISQESELLIALFALSQEMYEDHELVQNLSSLQELLSKDKEIVTAAIKKLNHEITNKDGSARNESNTIFRIILDCLSENRNK